MPRFVADNLLFPRRELPRRTIAPDTTPQLDKIQTRLLAMIDKWKQCALEIVRKEWYDYYFQHMGTAEDVLDTRLVIETRIKAVRTVDDVFRVLIRISRRLGTYITQTDIKSLCFREGEWDWWVMESDWRERLEWRGFLVQFLPQHRKIRKIELV